MKKSNAYLNSWLLIVQVLLVASALVQISPNAQASNKRSQLTSNFDAQQDPIRGWFNNYDHIRRQAQLSPAERQKAHAIMAKGLSIFMPGADKALAQNLLIDLVHRYDVAAQAMASLPVIAPTEQLHRAYYQYFVDARKLFSDYLKLQDDLLATDAQTGQPVASGLVERKENLAALDQNNKILDEKLRQQFGIPAYQYKPGLSQPQTQYQNQPQQPGVSTYPQSYSGQSSF